MGRPLAALSVLLQPLGLAGPFGTAREPLPCFWCLCRLPVLPRPAPPCRWAPTLGSALCASFATCTSRWALSFSSPGFCLLWALRAGCHWWGDSVGPCVSWQEACRSGLWLRKGTLCL